MKAIQITAQGGPEVLRVVDREEPSIGPEGILVKVRSFGLNRADLLQCLGLYPAPFGYPQDVPGLEYAGEVVAVGAMARRFKVGDRVMGIVGGGAFAQRISVHEREAIPCPSRLTFEEAAAIPEVFLTAFDALVLQGGLRIGESVLIHAAGSGVGTAACQIARAAGATVIGTSRTAQKLALCRERFGLAHSIACPEGPVFSDSVKRITAGRGVDVVLELAGGPYLAESLLACAPKARVLLVGLLAGRTAQLDLGRWMQGRARLIGSVLRSRPLEEKIAVAQAFERDLSPRFETGELQPVLDRTFPVSEIPAAFAHLSSNASFGKVALSWPD